MRKSLLLSLLLFVVGCPSSSNEDFYKNQADFWHKQSDFWQAKANEVLDLGQRCVVAGEKWKARAEACESQHSKFKHVKM